MHLSSHQPDLKGFAIPAEVVTAARRADGGRGDGARAAAETLTLSGECPEVESPLKGDLPRRGSFKMLQVEQELKYIEAKCDP